MDTLIAAELLAALGHESRLGIFRLLVEAGPDGMCVAPIGEMTGLALATLSFHLSHLSRVGLISGTRESRFIRYTANYPTMDDLLAFLTQNCCQGEGRCFPKASACETIEQRRAVAGKLES